MSPPRNWQSSVFTAAPSELFETEGSEPVATSGSRYTRGPELGRGGMGVVWLVHDHWLHRDVAMKRPSGEWGAALHAQLRNEAAVNARLNHPGIAALLDLGEDESGVYYTMPVLVGATLGERLKDPTFTLAEAIRALLLAARVVAYAHTQGVVHRDLKPDNLFVGEHGEVWVLDWGLAVDVGDVPTGWVGTRGYAAPEQGESAAHPRADVFSLGRILQAVLSANTQSPSELFTVVRRSSRSSSTDRWQSIQPFIQSLTDWSEGLPIASHRYPIGSLLRLWVARNRRALVGLSLLGVVGLVMLASVIQARWSANQQTREALAASLSIQAASEWAEGHQAAAEVLAAAALDQADNPVARGVRMSRSDTPPIHIARYDLPCDSPFLTQRGSLLCMVDDVVVEFALNGERRDSWSPPRPNPHARPPLSVAGMVGDEVIVRGVFGRFERWGETAVELEDRNKSIVASMGLFRSLGRFGVHNPQGLMWSEPVCPMEMADLSQSGDAFGITCDTGEVYRGKPGSWTVDMLDTAPNRIVPLGDEWVMTSWLGELFVSNGQDWSQRRSGVAVVADIVVLDEHRVAVLGERGDVRVHDLRGPGVGVAVQGRGERLSRLGSDLVVLGRTAIDVWTIPSGPPVAFDRSEFGGTSTFRASPSSQALLGGYATGRLELLDLATGRARMLVDSDIRNAQGSTMLTDTQAVIATSTGQYALDLVTGETALWPGDVTRQARLVGDAVFMYGWSPAYFCTEDSRTPSGGMVADAVVEGDLVTIVRTNGEIAQSRAQAPFEVVGNVGIGGRLAHSGGHWWFASDRDLTLLDSEFRPVWTVTVPEPISRLVASSHGAVFGDSSGGLSVVGLDKRTLARLPSAHQRRVTGLVMVDDTTVWSSSYDGFVRRWTLDGLLEPAELAVVQEQWALSKDDLLVQ